MYQKMMDLHLVLSDVGEMGLLMLFLDSVTPNNPGLIKLNAEIENFTNRVKSLVDVSKS